MPKNLELKGVVLAFIAMALFNVSDGAWKYALHSFDLPLVVVVHCVVASLGMFLYARISNTSLVFQKKRNIAIFSALLVISTTGFALALRLMPMAQLFVILLTTPLGILVASHLFLGEKLSRLQIASVLIGFAGALVVVIVPSLLSVGQEAQHFSWLGVFFALLCVASNILRSLFVRKIAVTENALAMTLGSFMMIALVYALPAFTAVKGADVTPLIIVSFTSLCAAAGMTIFVKAFQMARAGLVGATQYSQMIWSALMGTFIFAEPLTGPTLVGAGFILASGVLLVLATLKQGKNQGF